MGERLSPETTPTREDLRLPRNQNGWNLSV